MEATDILKREHRAIESVLDSLKKACDALQAGKEVPDWIFADGLDFMRGFADRCHHAKEEDWLFPLLGQRGMSTEAGPIKMMLTEHEEARRYVREAAGQFEGWTTGDRSAGIAMTEALQSCIDLLRQHIYKEDNVLYPMGDRLISEADDRRLVKQFDEVEEQEMGPGVHERYHAMIDKLEAAASKF